MINKFIEYLKSTKNLSPKTLEAYSIDLKKFMQVEKNQLNPNICAYVLHLQKDSSVKRKIVTLRIFYDINLKFKFRQEMKLSKIFLNKRG